MGRYVELKKFLLFVFLSVCVRCDSGRRINSVRLKFGTNVYALYKISCIVFGVHCEIVRVQGYTRVSQYVTAYGGKFLKISFDIVIVNTIE